MQQPATLAKPKIIDLEAVERFWQRESQRMSQRNAALSAAFRAAKEEIARRKADHEHIVVTCMDERAAHIDEALGLLPGEAHVYASGGGKIDAETFQSLFGEKITACEKSGRTARVFLVPHECSHDPHLGCAAFGNDTDAQKVFFTELKRDILARHPKARVHVMAMCTTVHCLRDIDVHDQDDHLPVVRTANKGFEPKFDDVQHAGYGIYIGDAYRAWIPGRNTYFRLSAENPNLAGNAEIALTVMDHHSEVDLTAKPVVLHIDYPLYANAARTEAAEKNIESQIDILLASPVVKQKMEAGAFRIVRTETDIDTWMGKVL